MPQTADPIDPGTVVRWVNEGRSKHNVIAGQEVDRLEVRRRSSPATSRAPARQARGVRVLLHASTARRARACTARSSCRTPTAPSPAIAARRRRRGSATGKPRTIRVPRTTTRRSRPRSTGPARRLILVVARRLPRGGDGHDRRPRHPRARPQPGDPRRRVQARQRLQGARRRRRRDREHDRAELHAERLLLDRRQRLPRLVPQRDPQRRLRHLRVRLDRTGSSTTTTGRARPTPASTSASASRATRSITDSIAEYNGIGYSGTNAGGNLIIMDSIWRHNRVGIVPNSGDGEKNPPEHETTIVGNLVYGNNNARRPRSTRRSLGRGQRHPRRRVATTTSSSATACYDHDIARHRRRPEPGHDALVSNGNRVVDNVVTKSGDADLGRVRRRRQLLRGQHVQDEQAVEHRAGAAVHGHRHPGDRRARHPEVPRRRRSRRRSTTARRRRHRRRSCRA